MIDLLKDYIEKRLQLIKLELIGVFANIGSSLVSSFLILVFVLFILLMLSLSLAFWVSELLNNLALGFAIVGGFYIFIFVLYMFIWKEKINTRVKDTIVKHSLNSEEKLDKE